MTDSVLGRYADLKDKAFLVTGASSGIGLSCARALLDQGARVAAHYRNHGGPVETLAGFAPERVIPVQADLALEKGCVGVMETARREMGGLDGLVHSAGIWNDGEIRTLSSDTLETMFKTNAFSSYYLAREAARTMGRGSLVFIGSTAGERGEPAHGHYAGSKGAVQSLVFSLAQELAPDIRVNLVSPGWVRTPMSAEALEKREEAIVRSVPLRRVAEPEDAAAAVLFLLSSASRHVTGLDLALSGGALLPLPRG
ncbi:MAG: SDR family NAD(P)-dependent oxidoreductase [Acidobacteriota bacterium]